jgi:ubiquinone/menaquinone biosynthesis C-methylase UbiE
MNRAESLWISSRFRTSELRNRVAPRLVELGGRTDGVLALDVGCGAGECVACELDLFGAKRVAAIDLDPRMVERARSRLSSYGDRAAAQPGDVTALRFDNEKFGAVFNFAVLHHVTEWEHALSEIARVLEPGGRFFSQDHDVAHHSFVARHLFSHPTRFTNAAYLDALERVGLDVIGIDDKPAQLLVVARKPSRN